MANIFGIATAPACNAQRLDMARIGGISSAIALHVIAFGLLLMPAQVPMQSPVHDNRTRLEPIIVEAPPPPPPPTQVQVVERPRIAPQRNAPTTPRVQPAQAQDSTALPDAAPDSDPPLLVDDGDAVIAPHDGGGTTMPGDGAPINGIALQYLSNPKPAYPREALREGLQGTVLLRVLVDESGRPLEVSIASSSGHRVLDRAAREQVLRKWQFVPAMRDGRPVRAVGTVPVAFSLDG